MRNFRKYREKNNTVMFVNSDGMRGKMTPSTAEKSKVDLQKDIAPGAEGSKVKPQIDVASATTLIVGKNNAGKTSIIHALLKVIKNNETEGLQVSDFNFHYLKECFDKYHESYMKFRETGAEMIMEPPFMEFVVTIAFEKDSDDLLTNLIPFMLLKDIDEDKLDIVLRYEVVEKGAFDDAMKSALDKINEKKQNTEKNKESDNEKEFQILLKALEKVYFHIKYYRFCKEEGEAEQQLEEVNEKFKLSNVMDIKFIQANNIKKDEELSEAFNKIISYRYEKIVSDKKKELDENIDVINDSLTENIKKHHSEGINRAIGRIVASDIMNIDLSSNITEEKLMRGLLSYSYVEKGMNIPEGQFGLGYTHLVKIVAELIDYMEHYPDEKHNSKINLIAIEEPEAFMHPQMQELFIKNINDALQVLVSTREKKLNSQLFITTHSSHILNSKIHMGNSLDDICYVYEESGCVCAQNLNNESVMPDTIDIKDQDKDFEFLKKHIKYKVSELFFADAVILVEGFAEETILPFYLEQESKLNKRYVSIFGINGAHAFLYKNLLEKLRIPAVIVTDLDIFRKEGNDGKKELYQITNLDGQSTTNRTIKYFNGNSTDLSKLPPFIENDNIYVTYQWEIGKFYPTSFEEAFILTNADNEILNVILKDIKKRAYQRIVEKNGSPDYEQNKHNSYEWQEILSSVKGEFASKLLYALITEPEDKRPKLPMYIKQGLEWLSKKLG